MTANERLIAIANASEETLLNVDAVLAGRGCARGEDSRNDRLMTITDAGRYLNVSYQKMYRVLEDGMLDVVTVNGRRMVREQSVIEMSRGLRRPTPEAVARRAARNAARRADYRRTRNLGVA